MNVRTDILKQLVANGSYPIDETAIAEAILVRSRARWMLPEIAFRTEPSPPRVRSFRLARAERRTTDRFVSPAGQLAHAA